MCAGLPRLPQHDAAAPRNQISSSPHSTDEHPAARGAARLGRGPGPRSQPWRPSPCPRRSRGSSSPGHAKERELRFGGPCAPRQRLAGVPGARPAGLRAARGLGALDPPGRERLRPRAPQRVRRVCRPSRARPLRCLGLLRDAGAKGGRRPPGAPRDPPSPLPVPVPGSLGISYGSCPRLSPISFTPGTVMQTPNCSPSPNSQLSAPPLHQGDRDTNNPSGSKNTLPESAASAWLGNLLKMPALRPLLRPTEPGTVGAQQVIVMQPQFESLT